MALRLCALNQGKATMDLTHPLKPHKIQEHFINGLVKEIHHSF
jgi:hypothetical protein